jgi:probable F420-dependent oxidoreductase
VGVGVDDREDAARISAGDDNGAIVKFGVNAYPYTRYPDVAALVEWVQEAEAAGYSFVSLPEHTIFPVEHERTMGRTWWESVTLAAYLAAKTSTIRLVFGIVVLPQHNPVYLAKQLATLDIVSGGRVDVGIGLGWLSEELEVLGADLRTRAARTEEYVAAMRALWTSDPVDFNGRFVSFSNASFEPKPVQVPHPPLMIGGSWRFSAPRAAAIGDGWYPMGGTQPDEVEEGMTVLRSELARHGRLAEGFPVVTKLPMWEASTAATEHALAAGSKANDYFEDDYDAARDYVRRFQALGVTHLNVETRAVFSESLDQVRAVAENVIAPLA